jgi:hypothetical protein
MENPMSATFFWRFYGLMALPSYEGMVNVIHSVKYRLHCSIDNQIAYKDGVINFAPPDAMSFVGFDDVSQDIFIGFVEAALGSALDTMKEELIAELNEPLIETRSLPWESKVKEGDES